MAEEHRLPMLNAVLIPQGVDDAAVRGRLLNEFGIEIGAGLGPDEGQDLAHRPDGRDVQPSQCFEFLGGTRKLLGYAEISISSWSKHRGSQCRVLK